MTVLTLTTDFGDRDGYVGVMKGVILGIESHISLVDITHHISPQDVVEAAFILYTSYRHFPPSTVHLVVVDPGVGSARRPLAVRTTNAYFVAPDNGVLAYVLQRERDWEAVELTQQRYLRSEISRTFHGRDIFALAAAYLASGVALQQLGMPVADLVPPPLPLWPQEVAGGWDARVLHIDHFGNVITNMPAQWLPTETRGVCARLRDRRLCQWRATYAEGDPEELMLLVGSSEFVEIAQRDGNAAEALGARRGDAVQFGVELPAGSRSAPTQTSQEEQGHGTVSH